jgi:putative acyl-CoA dehydrogenase
MTPTHDVFNQAEPLVDVNLFAGNLAMQAALQFNAPGMDTAPLHALGELAGSADMQQHARLANTFVPQLKSHSRLGHRIDQVEFHPSYHALMSAATGQGLHGTPWAHTRHGASLPLPPAEEGRGEGGNPHLQRAAAFMLFTCGGAQRDLMGTATSKGDRKGLCRYPPAVRSPPGRARSRRCSPAPARGPGRRREGWR